MRVVRRQVLLLGRFIADFLAPSARLIVEVDGASHQDAELRDARRDAVLAWSGYRVLRLSASLVSQDPHEAIRLIRSAL